MPMNLDPLLDAVRPGVFLVFASAIAAVFAAVLAEQVVRTALWISGLPERRRRAHWQSLHCIVRDWKCDEVSHVPPPASRDAEARDRGPGR